MKDLFEYYQEQPKILKNICEKWSLKEANNGLNYKDCEQFLNEIEKVGYTFEYDLSAEPYNLQKQDEFLTGILTSDYTEEERNEFLKPEAMKTINIFNELKSKTRKFVKNFITDFDIDKIVISKNPNKNFIHVARENGTHITIFNEGENYPKLGETIKYLFGTADRREIIKNDVTTLLHYLKREPKSVYYYNGSKLQKVTTLKAEEIFRNHYTSILNQWNEEEFILTNS